MQVEKTRNNVLKVHPKTKHFKLLAISDVHFDSPQCDRESLLHHLQQAQDQGAYVLIIGDWFDAMGCFRDPRTKAADIDPLYIQKGRQYLDLVVEDSYEFLKPFANNILMISYGNHETAILKHRDTDPLERLLFLLNQNANVQKGAYSGWIRIVMGTSIVRCAGFNIRYHHGKGGSAQRSKDVLQAQIDAMVHPDAHLIISGHTHNKVYDPSNVRRRLANNGTTWKDTIHWLKLGSYKISSDDDGFEVQRGFTPKRMGGWWIDITLNRLRHKNGQETVYNDCIVTEATPKRHVCHA